MHRSARLVGGLVLFGIAIGLLARARIGVPPWDVLAQGVAHAFALTFGISTMIVSGIVLLLGGNLGWGTLAFALMIGPVCAVTIPLFAREWGRGGEPPETAMARAPSTRGA